jgi:uncharacterized protein YndB with AHSA1/START domain
MPKNIIQRAVFPTTPEKLYELYMNAKLHKAFTGMPVSIQKKIGSSFKAFGGMLKGKILYLVPGRMIVQSWRSVHFGKKDGDSILILTFSKVKGGTRIDMIHAGVADRDYRGVKNGWPKYYWKPMATYLKMRR